MTKRNFAEERQYQIMREELEKLVPPHIRAIYEQNPLLRFLMNAPAKEIVAYREKS